MSRKNKREAESEENSGKRSKRKNSEKVSKSSFSKFCAFWGITLAALLFAVNALLKFLDDVFGIHPDNLGTAMSAIDFISKIALLVAVGIPAYSYVYNKKLAWKIVFVAAVAFYACFCIYRLF